MMKVMNSARDEVGKVFEVCSQVREMCEREMCSERNKKYSCLSIFSGTQLSI